jgi:hypothetical protein
VPHLTIALDPIAGPAVPLGVAISQARRDALTKAGREIPPVSSIRALVDTGASCTCIDPAVVAALELPARGTVAVHTPSTGPTPHIADEYEVSLVLPGAGTHHVPLTIDAVPVIAADLAIQGIHAIIGRDVLQDCILIYNGTVGEFTLAF